MANVGVLYRVSTGRQDSDNQIPDVERFCDVHGHTITATYTISDSAWKNGGGPEYKAAVQQAQDDAWAGKFTVLVIWALDRLVRDGPEEALRLFREFAERGCIIMSVKESWLNGSPDVQKLLISFAGWMSEQESRRRSERTKAGIDAKRRQQDLPVGRLKGSKDKGRRKSPKRRKATERAWEPGGSLRVAADRRKAERAAAAEAAEQSDAA
jgi:DNA invertase Pin-like site-specific DNA recombinase